MADLNTIPEYQKAIGEYQAELIRHENIIKKLRQEIQGYKESTALIFAYVLKGDFETLTRLAKKAEKENLFK